MGRLYRVHNVVLGISGLQCYYAVQGYHDVKFEKICVQSHPGYTGTTRVAWKTIVDTTCRYNMAPLDTHDSQL